MKSIMAQKRDQRKGEKIEIRQKVLLKDDSPRHEWTKGEIKELLVSHDGKKRNILVKITTGKELKRVARTLLLL